MFHPKIFQPHVDGTDDRADWNEVLEAMEAMMLSDDDKYDIIATTAAVLHLGNIEFEESGVEVSTIVDSQGVVKICGNRWEILIQGYWLRRKALILFLF